MMLKRVDSPPYQFLASHLREPNLYTVYSEAPLFRYLGSEQKRGLDSRWPGSASFVVTSHRH